MENYRDHWPFTDGVSWEISIYEGPDVFLEEYNRALPHEQLAFVGFWFWGEWGNGGLCQFFDNDTGVLAPEAVMACRTVGMPLLASKLEQAMKWFGSEYPRDREVRQEAIRRQLAVSDRIFSALDDEIGELMYEENSGIEQAMLAYIEKNIG